MALPAQVQQQMDELDELEKQLSTPAEAPETGEGGDTETPTSETPSEAQAAEAPAAEPKPAESADTVEEESYKQKYNSLRGKFDSTVGPLNDRIRELTAQVEQLQGALLAQQEAASAPPPEPLVTDAEREEFGEDLLDVQRRIAQEVAQEYAGRIEQLSNTITELRTQLGQTGKAVGEMSFAQKLGSLVPDFQEVDKDPRWAAWLNVEDPFTRAPRRDAAQAAFNAGDAESVAHYVSLFKQSLGDTPAAAPAQTPAAELTKQVAPDTSNSARAVSTKPKHGDKLYSPRDMDVAWGRVRELNSRGKLDEAKRLEDELTAAYVEGRVRA